MSEKQNGDVLKLMEQANTYKLTMIMAQNLLEVHLQDFVEWAFYAKVFSKCDGESEEQMSVAEFYEVFAKSEIDDLIALRVYKFGTVVKVDEKHAFKIDAGGKITAYWVKVDPNSREEKLFGT